MPRSLKRTLFAMFVLSGFSGLVYQVVWVRMALASFGVITPVVSVVVSVFMLGLAVGSWAGGRWIERSFAATRLSPIAFYGGTELFIALGALVLPRLFVLGRSWLLPVEGVDSATYLVLSAVVIAIAVFPWCFFMGATLPLVMAFVRQVDRDETTSFSFLYLANVVGAMAGTLLTSFVLIELFGLERPLWLAASFNGIVAAVSFALAGRHRYRDASGRARPAPPDPAMQGPAHSSVGSGAPRLILFTTGFVSMALEMVWMRAFTPVTGTLVYAFAGVLAVYLLATWLGSWLYRRHAAAGSTWRVSSLLAGGALGVLLTVLVGDPRVGPGVAGLLVSIFPFCFAMGYLTPMLIDRRSRGEPAPGGSSYAVNVIGSILGPLVATYLLLPTIGARAAALLLAAPLVALSGWTFARRPAKRGSPEVLVTAALLAVLYVVSAFVSRSYEDGSAYDDPVVRRDHTATVISVGDGLDKRLIVNGVGMTRLDTVTKIMAHMPLAFLERPPDSTLILCFGMGTSFRSALTWEIDVTAVELVPSVVQAFDYYHADAAAIMADPRGRVVVDDGRRFLAREGARFDVISIDPPPPVEAAGSSLLYAEEMIVLAKRRLKPGGILHHWYPGGEEVVVQALTRSLVEQFPHVRAFVSYYGWGLHYLASMEPFQSPDPVTFASRMPPAARDDLMEWENGDLTAFLERVLAQEIDLTTMLDPDATRILDDEHPLNEYFLLRRLAHGGEKTIQVRPSTRP
jgi:spermidine synthase